MGKAAGRWRRRPAVGGRLSGPPWPAAAAGISWWGWGSIHGRWLYDRVNPVDSWHILSADYGPRRPRSAWWSRRWLPPCWLIAAARFPAEVDDSPPKTLELRPIEDHLTPCQTRWEGTTLGPLEGYWLLRDQLSKDCPGRKIHEPTVVSLT